MAVSVASVGTYTYRIKPPWPPVASVGTYTYRIELIFHKLMQFLKKLLNDSDPRCSPEWVPHGVRWLYHLRVKIYRDCNRVSGMELLGHITWSHLFEEHYPI